MFGPTFGFLLLALMIIEVRSIEVRRRAIAAGELRYAAVTADQDGVTVGLIPSPWFVFGMTWSFCPAVTDVGANSGALIAHAPVVFMSHRSFRLVRSTVNCPTMNRSRLC